MDTEYPRRAALPCDHRIHAIHYRAGALLTACGRALGNRLQHHVTDHGDDAPVTCPECRDALETAR